MEKIIGLLLRRDRLNNMIIRFSLPSVKGSPPFFEKLARNLFLGEMNFSSSGLFFQGGTPRTNRHRDDST
jgi:hypothetical protein